MMKNFIKKVVKCGVKYFAANYFFNVCKNTHYTVSTKETCEECGEEIIDQLTRIVGFLVPKSSWAKERRLEFDTRKRYLIESLNLK